MNLRPYQLERVRAAYRDGARSVLMQLWTGGGKTATASTLIERGDDRPEARRLRGATRRLDRRHERAPRRGGPRARHRASRSPDERGRAPVQVASFGPGPWWASNAPSSDAQSIQLKTWSMNGRRSPFRCRRSMEMYSGSFSLGSIGQRTGQNPYLPRSAHMMNRAT